MIMDLKKSIQQDLQRSLQNEILTKISFATSQRLIPPDITEIEFNIDATNGHCAWFEYWKSTDRLPKDHQLVMVPEDHLEDFVFKSFSEVVRS